MYSLNKHIIVSKDNRKYTRNSNNTAIITKFIHKGHVIK